MSRASDAPDRPDGPNSANGINALLTRRGLALDGDVHTTILPQSTTARGPRLADLVETIRARAGVAIEAPAPGAPPSSSSASALLSDLSLERTLARGGSSVIRLARQPSLNREVAIKSLLPTHRRPRDVEALYREACVAGRLDHPNVVPIHALGVSAEDGPFLVMKRVVGRSWHSRLDSLDRSRVDWLAAELRVLLEVCRAVTFAHDRGVVHRDIKPANIMLGTYGEVYLLDWGAALYHTEDDDAQRRELVGTPAYMAPEQATAGAPADPRTDVYLLGACLVHLLTGAPPHHQPSDVVSGEGLAGVLQRAQRSNPVPIPEDFGPVLADIVHRACAPDPDDRFQTAGALSTAIAGYLDHQVSRDTTRRADEEVVALRAMLAPQPSEPSAPDDVEDHEARRAVQIQRQFAVCRFAYEQALQQWPQNAAAGDGLRALLQDMVVYELARGNVAGAEGLLAELADPPAALVDALQQRRVEQQERQQALDEVAHIRGQQRFEGLDWTRSILSASGGVGCCAAGVIVGVGLRAGWDIGPGTVSLVYGFGAVATMAVIRLYRDRLQDSTRYARFLQGYTVLVWTACAYLATAWAVGIPLVDTWLGQCFVGVATALTLAVTVEWRMWPSVAFAAATGGLTQVWPAYAADLVGLGFGVNGLFLAWAVRPGRTFGGSGRAELWLDQETD